jgi:hypothetical protein
MPSPSSSRLQGDDYQHLFSWQFVLELLMPSRRVCRVTLEDSSAGSLDDVTVQHEADSSVPDAFYQIKYHVDHRGEYSSTVLASQKLGETSLLAKFWHSWQLLRTQHPGRAIELHLLSNWTWDASDAFRSCIDGRDNRIKGTFLTASVRSDVGKIRKAWESTLGGGKADFESFISSLRFRVGFDCAKELEERVAERMGFLGLKSDQNALLISVGIVRNWIKSGRREIYRGDVEQTVRRHGFYLPTDTGRGVTVYLTTIKEQQFDLPPDHVLDWRDYFIGDATKKGHQLRPSADWNRDLLPQLLDLEARINRETDCRLIRARGLARLSAWFAFGFCFSEVARFTIEVDQYGALWRTDAAPSPDFRLLTNNKSDPAAGEILAGTGKTVAVGVSVSGLLDDDVRNCLSSEREPVRALLLIRPEREPGRTCLRDAGDLAARADGVKKLALNFVKRSQAEKLLLFYYGPFSGACFIGHRLNAICRGIQIMEDQHPGYAPSFLLN